MYSTITRNVLFPIAEKFSGTKMIWFLKKMEKNQWLKPDLLEKLQNDNLRWIINHSYINVPYYNRLFKTLNLTPSDIKSKEDLEKLPVLTKKDIRDNFDDLKAQKFTKWKPYYTGTGGSTGEILRYYITNDNLSATWAATFRAWAWGGYELGKKRITLAGSSLNPTSSPNFKERMRDKIERNKRLSSFDMTDETKWKYIKILRDYRPQFLRGYASALYQIAKFVENETIQDIEFKAIFSTAEMLYKNQRKLIEKQFNSPVFNNYGTRDGSANANECAAHEGLHQSVDISIMEITKNGKQLNPGEEGQVIVTDFYNYAMPFIRYNVEDFGIERQDLCSCGRTLPLLEKILGRSSDFIITPLGRMIHGEFFSHIFRLENWVRQFQIVQVSKNNLEIRIIPLFDDITEKEIKVREIIEQRSDEMTVNFKYVEKIPLLKSGKHRFVIGLNS